MKNFIKICCSILIACGCLTAQSNTNKIVDQKMLKDSLNLMRSHSGVINILDYPVYGDGIHEDSTAFKLAIRALYNQGGGALLCPKDATHATYKISCALKLPHDTNNPAFQPTIRIYSTSNNFGVPASNGGYGNEGGATLDLRYSGAYGKIQTFGKGGLELDHITLKNGGSDNTPFLYTTMTTLKVHHVNFIGVGSDTACTTDPIIFGGTTTANDTTPLAQFVGYGSEVYSNKFSHVRTLQMRIYANSIDIHDNYWDARCGGSTAISSNGDASEPNQGIIIERNLIQSQNYKRVITLRNTKGAHIISNSHWDQSAYTQYSVYSSNSSGNVIWNTVVPGMKSNYDSLSTNRNTYINPVDGGTTNWIGNFNLGTNGTPLYGMSALTYNGLTLTPLATGFSIAGGTTNKTLTVDINRTLSDLAPSVSPSFTTPALGVATATSLAIGGATIGSDALAVSGTSTFNDNITMTRSGTATFGIISTGGSSIVKTKSYSDGSFSQWDIYQGSNRFWSIGSPNDATHNFVIADGGMTHQWVSVNNTNGNTSFLGTVSIGNTVSSVNPTSPNRTIAWIVGGVTLYVPAKTTND